jgi:uncharacterized protein (TIGR00369 family)
MSATQSAPRTHRAIDRRLVGEAIELTPGRARVRLVTVPEMAADERGLVHGGFVFGLADYAAMLAVDDPLVVLAAAEVRFLAPVRVGERLEATAERVAVDGRRHRVRVVVEREAGAVLEVDCTCVVPAVHVLDRGRSGSS